MACLTLTQEAMIKEWCRENSVEEPYSAYLKCVCCGQRLIDWHKITMTSEGPVGAECSGHFPETRCHGQSLQARFLGKVRKTETCWEWIGAKMGKGLAYGYGKIGEGGHRGKSLYAHRLAYELFVGPIPEGMRVLHHCDNPGCVNPQHLFLGTQADNLEDMTMKGRRARGEHQGAAKLTQEQVQEIRERYQAHSSEFGSTALGRRYGVSHSIILGIVKGQRWRAGPHD